MEPEEPPPRTENGSIDDLSKNPFRTAPVHEPQPLTPKRIAERVVKVIQALMLCGLGGLVTWLFLTSTQVSARLDEICERGEPATLADLNAYYRVPEGQVDSSGAWNDALRDIDLRKSYQYFAILTEDRPEPPSEIDYEWTDLPTAREFLADMQVELNAIRRAADTGNHATFEVDLSQVDYDETHLDKLRWMTRVLHLDAWVAVVSGDEATALQDIKAQIAIADALRYEPDIIGQMSRSGITAIGRHTRQSVLPHINLSDGDLADLQTRLLAPDIKASLHLGLTGERVRYRHQLNAVLPRPIAGPINLTILNYYEELMALLEHDWPRLIAEQKRLDDSVASRRPSVVWVLSQLHVTESAARVEALRRCEFVALAIRRHKLAHNDIPQSLDQIADEFLTCPAGTCILTDPFDGQPLRFQVEENSITIYSIGSDMKDDGGSLWVPGARVAERDYGIKIAYPNSGLHLSQTSQP